MKLKLMSVPFRATLKHSFCLAAILEGADIRRQVGKDMFPEQTLGISKECDELLLLTASFDGCRSPVAESSMDIQMRSFRYHHHLLDEEGCR